MDTLTVPPEAEGWRLDQFLVSFHGDYSRSFAQKLIRQAHVLVDGRSRKASFALMPGMRVTVDPPPPEQAELEPEPIPLDVLYEDRELIVVNKPAGLSVHPGAGQPGGTLANALLAYCGSLSQVGGVKRPGIVHRLDKGTSGVLVAAKNDLAHQDLAYQFRQHSIGRRYLAIVCGEPAESHWTMDTFIGRSSRNRRKMTVVEIGGRRAVTHFEVCERFGQFALMSVQLETGRTHQIRVHLTHCGYPVVGDSVYGGGQRRAMGMAEQMPKGLRSPLKHALAQLNRQALHAERLAFLHPVSRERMEFRSPVPPDMQSILDVLRT